MFDRHLKRRPGARIGLLAPIAASVLLLGTFDVARADGGDGEWAREMFRKERPTVVASLSSDDDDDDARPARRRAPRASIARSRKSITRGPSENRGRSRHSKAKSRKTHVRVASLGNSYVPAAKPARSIARGGSVRWVASAGCLNGSLRGVIAQVAARFGSVTVNSTCRSRSRNARVGGARRSQHLSGNAADFRIHGNWGAASSFIRGLVGGFKHYGGGLFHIDTGPRRTW